ncbi:MAG: Nif3-like dinuclear metal center hexameric protein [Prevotellaceae bacterium]|jgi:dinuclear metal center YbgI/SA1388 family protein|nr:Nif3-like dinuclear metal center hexameric protein [Prevotellaceae bacterium]
MKIKEVVSALEQFAPLPLQDDFDNAGLQIGLTEAEAAGALLCLDVTEAVLDEALALGYNLVISHHPLLFKGCKSITGATYVERCIAKAIKHDLVLYASHTNLDNARGGVNYKIAEVIGLERVRPLAPNGAGVIGSLPAAQRPEDFLQRIKTLFGAACIRHNAFEGGTIESVALCGGAGSFLIPQAIVKGADLFLTGEIKYHEFFGHETQLLLCEIGHYESEQYTRELLAQLLTDAFPTLPVRVCKSYSNPIKYLT